MTSPAQHTFQDADAAEYPEILGAPTDSADLIEVPETALRALDVLERAGFEGWLVGGFVRDALLGRPVNDVDIATDARWQQVQEAFESQGCRTFETGVQHGTLTVQVGDDVFEVTTYRSDGSYSDARHPDSVTFVGSIEEDLARRDFTMNAIAYHPQRGLLDPFGGIGDLKARTIRAVGDPAARFGEDALRILRAVRFSSQLGFSIEAETARGMRAARQGLDRIAIERVRHELEAMLLGGHVHDAIMGCTDVLEQVVPELAPMRGFDQRTPYHSFDVLEHTAYVVQYTRPEPLVRWAALCHDMGKPDVFFTDENGQGHFYGHAKTSVVEARAVMERFKMGARFTHDLLLLVRHHDTVVAPEPKQVKRMLRRLDGDIGLYRTWCDLKRADSLAHAPDHRDGAATAEQLDACLDKILQAKEPFSLKDLAMSGHDVIAFGVPAGPQVGRILAFVLDAVIEGDVPNERAALLAFAADSLNSGEFGRYDDAHTLPDLGEPTGCNP